MPFQTRTTCAQIDRRCYRRPPAPRGLTVRAPWSAAGGLLSSQARICSVRGLSSYSAWPAATAAPGRPIRCRMACSLRSSGHGVSDRMPASSAKRTIRRTVFRSEPVDRAIARIFSPANHRRITWSISIHRTSGMPSSVLLRRTGWHNPFAPIKPNRGGWVNDPENVGEVGEKWAAESS